LFHVDYSMTVPTAPTSAARPEAGGAPAPDTLRRRLLANRRITTGGGFILVVLALCVVTLPWTGHGSGNLFYDQQHPIGIQRPQAWPPWTILGTTKLGQSMLGRCLLGGVISLAIGLAAATVSVVLGVTVGLVAGYRGGFVDGLLMRSVDVLYALPYILMVVLLKIALQSGLQSPTVRDKLHLTLSAQAVSMIVLFLAIGLVSWLTMARVIRGQVLALRQMPFIDAAQAIGVPEWRIFLHHLLPNLVGPISVYATLTVPSAILQESTLSFLGIGILPPLPTWGSLASEGLTQALNPIDSRWWLLVFPCLLLAATLLALNFLGDGLRDVFDPKRRAANV
jgi:oligopeptide transport system permease protein